MSAIDESIVREYFEQNGFFVRQARKYQVHGRKKTKDEEIDLLVLNPAWRKNTGRPDFLLFANELHKIHRAVVVVKGWHSDRFTPVTITNSPEIFRFLQDDVLKEVENYFPAAAETEGEPTRSGLLKILVLPGLPTTEPYKTQTAQMLRERGIDAIISFRSILIDLIGKVEINKFYRKSDTLQVLRILKNYDLLKDTQLDLFRKSP